VLVKNTGAIDLKNVPVTLEVDGARQEGDTGLIPEIRTGQIIPVTITAKLGKAGPRLLTAKLGGRIQDATGNTIAVEVDDLPGDNRFDKLITVRDRIRVLIVDGNPDPRDVKDSGSHYIRNALQPVPESQRSSYFIRVTEVPANEASASQLSETDICFLINTPSSDRDRPGIPGLPAEFVARLPKFVREGGALILSAGDYLVPARTNAALGSTGSGLLPFDFTEMVVAAKEKPFHPAPDTTLVPSFLAKFREEPYATLSADVDVLTILGVDETKGKGNVLLRLDNEKPLIASQILGEGEVLQIMTTLDARWTNWPARGGSYLSFVRFVLAHLTGKATRTGNRVAGEALLYAPVSAERPFELEKPDRTRMPLGKATGGDGQPLQVVATETTVAGEYTIGPEGETPLRGARYAVIPDLQESESLISLSDEQTEEAIGFKPVMVIAGTEAESQIGAERSRREWTIWILLALFLVAGAEAFWAWFCGKAW
jgi:hypothetical protein